MGRLPAWILKAEVFFNELMFRRGCPIFYAFDILYLNDRDLRQLRYG
jgi:ATP-dependent DNA ligase